MFRKIVVFNDGRYGIRRLTMFGYEYLDFNHKGIWWSKGSSWFDDCKSKDFTDVLRIFNNLSDNGTPV